MGVRYPGSGAVTAASSISFFVETPTGSVNGVVGPPTTGNTTFTILNSPRTPQINNIAMFQNGVLLRPNVDYTINQLTITFAVAPLIGDILLAIYVALI